MVFEDKITLSAVMRSTLDTLRDGMNAQSPFVFTDQQSVAFALMFTNLVTQGMYSPNEAVRQAAIMASIDPSEFDDAVNQRGTGDATSTE